MENYIPAQQAATLKDFLDTHMIEDADQWEKNPPHLYPLKAVKMDVQEFTARKPAPDITSGMRRLAIAGVILFALSVLDFNILFMEGSSKWDSVLMLIWMVSGLAAGFAILISSHAYLQRDVFPHYIAAKRAHRDIMVNSNPDMEKLYEDIHEVTEGDFTHPLWVQYEEFTVLIEDASRQLHGEYSGDHTRDTFTGIISAQKQQLDSHMADIRNHKEITMVEMDKMTAEMVKAQYQYLTD